MKIINCGIVTYIIIKHHVATICYDYNNGQPRAAIYYDGKLGEIVEAENGQTMRYAFRLVRWTIRNQEYWD